MHPFAVVAIQSFQVPDVSVAIQDTRMYQGTLLTLVTQSSSAPLANGVTFFYPEAYFFLPRMRTF